MKNLQCTETTFCDGLIKFSNGDSDTKGINEAHYMDKNFNELPPIPFLRYGSKKDERVTMNFCPFCGVSFMGRRRKKV